MIVDSGLLAARGTGMASVFVFLVKPPALL
jgi:hypothetical protein